MTTDRVAQLGSAVRAVLTARHSRFHDTGTNWLYDVILGGQDGLVNILGIILGVIAGGGSTEVLLASGFAAAITESISMGGVGPQRRCSALGSLSPGPISSPAVAGGEGFTERSEE